MPVIIDGTNGLTFPDNSRQYNGYFGFKNRIINGDMRIDQRNNGASVTQTTAVLYTLDRWFAYGTVTSKFTVQQNAGSVTPPAGFTNYLGVTSSAATSVGASDLYQIVQRVEGFNVADLSWGTASAQTITVSFWVRSSLTGTFGGSIGNSANNRSYPFSYTITAANTWEQKSVTIPGDTTGTWLTNNGTGLYISFGLGAGSTFSGTAGSWSGSNFQSTTGATSVVGTNGATFYITGVQLEEGVVSTNFDVLPYGTQLQLCQRYYYQYAPANTDFQQIATRESTTGCVINIPIPVSMRVVPSAVLGSSPYGRVVAYDSTFAVTTSNVTGFGIIGASPSTNNIHAVATSGSVTAAAGLYGFSFDTLGSSAGIGLSSEL